jgi:uncharacterized RDD family membrane protein YckC
VNPTHVMGRRVVAFIIDAVLLAALFTGLFFLVATHTDQAAQLTGTNLHVTFDQDTYYLRGSDATSFYVIELLIGLLYAGVIQGLTGRTVGKLICGIRVMREDGSPPGIGRGVLRWVLLIVDDFPYFIPMLTGFIVAMTNDRRQRVGDLAAGTFVVRAGTVGVPAPSAAPGAVATPPPPAAPAPPAPTPGTAPPTQQVPAAQPAAQQPAAAPEPAAPEAQPTGAQPTAPAPSAPPLPPANWYPDPSGQARLRYWDGSRWTSHTAQ